MPEWTVPDRSGSRAVLIGTSDYTELTSVPAAANSLQRMHRLLTGPLCLWPTEQVTLIADQRRPGDLPYQLVEIFSEAKDVALFYFVGHGQIDDEGHLCLALSDTRKQPTLRASTSLTFDAVRRALKASDAATKIVILDCCFAGLANHGPHMLAGSDLDVTALTSATGAYTLAATGPYSPAWFESDEDSPTPHTYFTKHFAEIVERGISGESSGLTLEPIYRRLREDLPAAGKPAPTRVSRDLADAFLFARNAAPRPVAPPPQVDSPSNDEPGDPARRFRLLDAAETAARAIDGRPDKAKVFIAISDESATDDPDRARRLLDDAERLAPAIHDRARRGEVRFLIAQSVAATDPDRAWRLLDDAEEDLHGVNICESVRFAASAPAFTALCTSAPDTAERIVRYFIDSINRDVALGDLACALDSRDPRRAERIARGIADPIGQDLALSRLARTAAMRDPDRAERISRSITEPDIQATTLARVAMAMLDYDPARALRLADFAGQVAIGCTTIDLGRRSNAIADVAEIMAAADPTNSHKLLDQAGQLIDCIGDPLREAFTCVAVANSAFSQNPVTARVFLDEAMLVFEDFEFVDSRAATRQLLKTVKHLADMDYLLALTLVDRIEKYAVRNSALVDVVAAMTRVDVDRVQGIAHHVTNRSLRARALANSARTLASGSPGEAHQLLEAAKHIARATSPGFTPDLELLIFISGVTAIYDVDASERLMAETCADSLDFAIGLEGLVEIVAACDLDRAEAMASTIDDPECRSRALLSVAKGLREVPVTTTTPRRP